MMIVTLQILWTVFLCITTQGRDFLHMHTVQSYLYPFCDCDVISWFSVQYLKFELYNV